MRISRWRLAGPCLALLAAVAATPASAVQTIDFNQPAFFGDGVSVSPGESVTIDGFTFTGAGRAGLDVFAIDGLPGRVGDGTPRLFANNDARVYLSAQNGAPFALLGMDFGGSWLDADKRLRWADAIEVIGYRSDGGVVTTILDLDATVAQPTLSPASLDTRFRSLSVVSFHGLGDVGAGLNNHEFVIDNLVVSQVPEPQTYLLLLAGLGLVAWKRRRRSDARHDARATAA